MNTLCHFLLLDFSAVAGRPIVRSLANVAIATLATFLMVAAAVLAIRLFA